jgi:hypothetical protein
MLGRALILGMFLVAVCGCANSSTNVTASPSPTATAKPYEFDRAKARAISDSMADALIKNDRSALFSKMEKAARDYYDQGSFDEIVDKMFEAFGKPIEAKF